MIKVLKTGVLATVLALLGAGFASANEIARPNEYSIGYSTTPGGKRAGAIKAETRGGLLAGYLVLERREVDGNQWVAVRLGWRPNDRVGWVRESRVHTIDARYRIRISLKNRTVALLHDGKRLWRNRVVIGRPSTPTPRGLFAIHDYYQVKNDLRPWQIELTAHSEVLDRYKGGPGRVALHGRHGSLRAPLGSRASNGCIRAPDWVLDSIRRKAPIGTPVEIR